MNFWRLSLIVSFVAVTLVCVGYAHSESEPVITDGTVWRHEGWALLGGDCEIKVRAEKGMVRFTALGLSKTEFSGFWPRPEWPRPLEFVEIEMTAASEKLAVKFKWSNQDQVYYPYSYIYNNLATQSRSRLVDSKSCPGPMDKVIQPE